VADPDPAENAGQASSSALPSPDALARFGRLELLARLTVEGVMTGLHKSPFKGFSVEFAEHRQYGPGDEIRHIDWRAFGKTDRYFVKEYEEETNLKAYLVLDASGSMGYAGSKAAGSKFEHARGLAASLAHLMIGQRDAVGLTTFDAEVRTTIPPRSAPGHLSVLCRAMEGATVGGETALSGVLRALADRIKKRGLVVILSDGFDRADALLEALRSLRKRRHEVLFFQTTAPEEEEFPFNRPARFRNLERPASDMRVDPAVLRAEYLERFNEHRRALREGLLAMNADYHPAPTSRPIDRILLDYLSERSARGRSTARP
jgi:uncharacterized protein (DUF58 family)